MTGGPSWEYWKPSHHTYKCVAHFRLKRPQFKFQNLRIFQAKVLEWGAIAFSDNPVYETAKETPKRTVFWTLRERERVG